MGLTESVLTKQIKRLRTMKFAPDDRETVTAVMAELSRVLRRFARSDDHCARIIDYVIETAHAFPGAAEIKEAAREVPEFQAETAPAGCSECDGKGMCHIEREVLSRATMKLEKVEAMTYCSCSKGQWLASKARERQAVSA